MKVGMVGWMRMMMRFCRFQTDVKDVAPKVLMLVQSSFSGWIIWMDWMQIG